MKKRVHRFFIGGMQFQKEFRRQLRLLIIITLGFTIAFTWRQTIFDASQALVVLLTNVQNSTSLSIITSVFISVFSLLLIYLTSQLLKDKPEYYQ